MQQEYLLSVGDSHVVRRHDLQLLVSNEGRSTSTPADPSPVAALVGRPSTLRGLSRSTPHLVPPLTHTDLGLRLGLALRAIGISYILVLAGAPRGRRSMQAAKSLFFADQAKTLQKLEFY